MTRYLTAGAMCLTLLLAGLAAPARADLNDEQVGRIIAGAALLGVLGLAIRQHERNNEQPQMAPQQGHRPHGQHGYQPQHGQFRATLPDTCRNIYQMRQGRVELYDPNCLASHMQGAGRLPLNCARTIRHNGYYISGFEPRCLAQHGYRVARYR